MTTTPTFDESELIHWTLKQALYLVDKYCCAKCYHDKGIATKLHQVQVPKGENFDRFAVICTECGENVASRSVGRITLWFLKHIGQQYIERGIEIRHYEQRLEIERQKQAGTYYFDEEKALRELGF